jgi:PncC family amidohydrolase
MKIVKELKNLCIENKITISVVESCTGGWIQKLITDVSRSSKYFRGGVVVYSNEIKKLFLGIKEETLQKCGAVSKEVALELAKNIKKICNTDVGLSTTGIAGPEGIEGKEVGLVYIGIASKWGNYVYKFLFQGSRNKIRKESSKKALKLLKIFLQNETKR